MNISKRGLLTFILAALAASTFMMAPPASASDDFGHFHGGEINFGEDTMIIDLVCRDERGQPIDVLFEILEILNRGLGDPCSNILFSGPLGDGIAELACFFIWSSWPVTATTHMEAYCEMHLQIFNQPFPPPTDALCNVELLHLFGGTVGNNSSGGSWHAADASASFDSVPVSATCPNPIPAALNFFIDSGTAILMDFLFT
jgi:hypothetical protein